MINISIFDKNNYQVNILSYLSFISMDKMVKWLDRDIHVQTNL